MTTFQASTFRDIKSTMPSSIIEATTGEFVAVLAVQAESVVSSKDSLFLYSPARYKLDAIPARQQGKTRDNIDFLNGIWLDADHCPLTPAQFVARCLPGTRVIVYSTFNSTRDAPRWRCYIPATQIIRSTAAYDIIAHEIVARTGIPNHGFDRSKLNGAALFYRPCKREASFFHDFPGQPLDPLRWIEQASDNIINRYTNDPTEVPAVPINIPVNPEVVERARREWRMLNHGARQDNDHFFLLGCRLAKAGCEDDQLTDILRVEAAVAHIPKDRLAQIPSILSSVKKYRSSWEKHDQPTTIAFS